MVGPLVAACHCHSSDIGHVPPWLDVNAASVFSRQEAGWQHESAGRDCLLAVPTEHVYCTVVVRVPLEAEDSLVLDGTGAPPVVDILGVDIVSSTVRCRHPTMIDDSLMAQVERRSALGVRRRQREMQSRAREDVVREQIERNWTVERVAHPAILVACLG